MKVRLLPCARCGAAHADWWKSVRPPGCYGQVKLRGR
jgi:hypothetical protein